MNFLSESLLELQKNLQILPGVGEKTAQRLAFFLVNQPEVKASRLAGSILNAIEKCKPCSVCFLLSDTNPCSICADTNRDNDILCIVESSRDIFIIENTKEYKGKYFVLGNLLSPIDGIGPKEIRINELINFLDNNHFKEIVLAIAPTTEGETTIQFLADFLDKKVGKITRLSTGIPYGGDMEYTGTTTMINAFKRRFEV